MVRYNYGNAVAPYQVEVVFYSRWVSVGDKDRSRLHVKIWVQDVAGRDDPEVKRQCLVPWGLEYPLGSDFSPCVEMLIEHMNNANVPYI